MHTNYPENPQLTGIVLAVSQMGLIADRVLPYLMEPVEKRLFTYFIKDMKDGYKIVETLVGRRSKPNEVETTATEASAKCVDHGLDQFVGNDDAKNAAPFGEKAEAAEDTKIMLDNAREKRVADLVHSSATYPVGNKVQKSGTSQFTDKVNSTPIANIQLALRTPIVRPNTMVLNQVGFDALCTHPEIVKAIHANSGDSGIVTAEQIATLFQLDQVLVGKAYADITNRGQGLTKSNIWGNHCALIHVQILSTAKRSERKTTFGFTAPYQTPVAAEIPTNKGLYGGVFVRVGNSLIEVICANDAGYFIEDIA